MGNLGGASVQCHHAPLLAGSIELACPRGTLIRFSDVQYGVINSQLLIQDFCLESEIKKRSPKDKVACTDYLSQEDRKHIDDQMSAC